MSPLADLGFLVTRSPHSSPGARSFYFLARAAQEEGHTVRAFFYMDGVYQCLNSQGGSPDDDGPARWLEELLENGAVMVASNRCMRSRGLDPAALLSGVRVGTMEELARLTGQADRVVCL